MPKKFYIIAGANGSGKSTLAKKLLADEDVIFLNADEFAKELSPTDIGAVKITAGKKIFSELETCFNQGKSIAIETTLSGTIHQKLIVQAREKGYLICLIYVFLDNVEMCIERVKIRSMQGGHFIPETDIRRRYVRSFSNFKKVYKDIVDFWHLFYNGKEEYILIANQEKTELRIIDEDLYNKFTELSK